ncbi:hypothetical protein M9H77_27405 [Catharanthus roseus]|uniref:Uncharacterized protein n=1 Tax=Catharanthus roseus TaxID=4058 RepID=A0ACC0ADW1_CATRO|nr:hypothetical protein M9H77_27405 [Catharanthus roseus]
MHGSSCPYTSTTLAININPFSNHNSITRNTTGKEKMEVTKLGVHFLLVLVQFLVLFQARLVLSERKTYIVHMDKTLMPKAFVGHESWYSSTIDAVKSTDSSSPRSNGERLVYAYDNALHGFSAVLSEDELKTLKKSQGFISAYPDKLVKLDTTHTTDFLGLNPLSGLWPVSEYGKDVIVGVIDTGIWPESQSYKDDGMTAIPSKWKGKCEVGQDFNSSLCNLKLIGAQYFNKGLRAANPNITISMNSTRDTEGHGTHTSSTVAGNYVYGASFFGYASGTAKGVAPRARLAMYKVAWDEGTYLSDMIAGMDQAVADGVDIISISMGLNFAPLYEDPVAIASFGAMENGVLVSSSAGNDGPGIGTLHNGIPWALTTAASTIDRSLAGILSLGNGQTIIGWSAFPARAFIQDLPLIYNKTLSACNSSELLSSVYGIVICEDSNSFNNQYYISQSSVPSVIFFSDDISIKEFSAFPNPGVVLSTKYKQLVINYALSGNNPSASITFQQTILGTIPAPAVADYSSRGPAPSCPGVLKPDIMSPGTLVLAAFPPNIPVASIGNKVRLSNDFALESGTSMACPHSSGIAALLKGAHPEWSPAAIKSAMMTTATTVDNTQSPIKDTGSNYDVASPLAMGAGFVNPNSALDPGLIYDATTQDYINLLCSMNFTQSQIATIVRSSSFNCSNPSPDLNYPSFIALYEKGNTSIITKKFERTVTNVGNSTGIYEAFYALPMGSSISVTPSKLIFKEKYEKQSYTLTITYLGETAGMVRAGSIIWAEVGGNHRVRSPIVIAPTVSW